LVGRTPSSDAHCERSATRCHKSSGRDMRATISSTSLTRSSTLARTRSSPSDFHARPGGCNTSGDRSAAQRDHRVRTGIIAPAPAIHGEDRLPGGVRQEHRGDTSNRRGASSVLAFPPDRVWTEIQGRPRVIDLNHHPDAAFSIEPVPRHALQASDSPSATRSQ
jgi:hypothetical protein